MKVPSWPTGCRVTRELATLREEMRKLKLEKHGLQKQIDEKFNKQVDEKPAQPHPPPTQHTASKTHPSFQCWASIQSKCMFESLETRNPAAKFPEATRLSCVIRHRQPLLLLL